MSTTIDDRMIQILTDSGQPHGWWALLEKETGVSAQRWRKVVARLQKPTGEMIEAVAKMWPQFAFYLATGITDKANGHMCPSNSLAWPERGNDGWSPESTYYFEKALNLQKALSEAADLSPNDNDARLSAYSRLKVHGKWHASKLQEIIDEMKNRPEYEDLINKFMERESYRNRIIEKMISEEIFYRKSSTAS